MKLLDLIKEIEKPYRDEIKGIQKIQNSLVNDKKWNNSKKLKRLKSELIDRYNCQIKKELEKIDLINKSLFKILEHIIEEGEKITRKCIDCDKEIGLEDNQCDGGCRDTYSHKSRLDKILSPIKQALKEYKGRDKNI
jgi:hypothetical protein